MYEHGTISGEEFLFVNGGSTSSGQRSTEYQSFYSPGICPSGYTTNTVVFSEAVQYATCCPSGYSLGSATASRNSAVDPPACTHTIVGDYMTLVAAGASNQTIPYPGTAVAPAVTVAYAEADRASLFAITGDVTGNGDTVLSATSASTPSATASETSSVSSEATPSATPRRGLSTGAQAGIGVGVSLAVILLAVGIGVFWKRSRKRGQQDRVQKATGTQFEKAELAGDSQIPCRQGSAELAADGAAVHEASSEAAKPAEMDSMSVRAELPGEWIGVQAPGPGEQRSPT